MATIVIESESMVVNVGSGISSVKGALRGIWVFAGGDDTGCAG
jgi:hypothetical protein